MVVTFWKMTRYMQVMQGVSVPGFASFLGSAGVVTSILKIILDGLNLLVQKSDSSLLSLFLSMLYRLPIPWRYHSTAANCAVGSFELLLNIGMVAFSYKLWKNVSDNNMVGMRSLIKIGCYIMAGLELLVCVLLIVYFALIFKKSEEGSSGIVGLLSVVFVTSAVFACLLIVGVWKEISGLVNCCILFKIFFFSFYIFFAIAVDCLLFTIKTTPTSMIGVILLIFFFYTLWLIFYSSSFTVLHYNIMLHDQLRYETLDLEKRQQQQQQTDCLKERYSTCLTSSKV